MPGEVINHHYKLSRSHSRGTSSRTDGELGFEIKGQLRLRKVRRQKTIPAVEIQVPHEKESSANTKTPSPTHSMKARLLQARLQKLAKNYILHSARH